jgi:hypothetical protein
MLDGQAHGKLVITMQQLDPLREGCLPWLRSDTPWPSRDR